MIVNLKTEFYIMVMFPCMITTRGLCYLYVSDIDECRVMPFLCRNGRCRNILGSFNCECAEGYVLAADGQHCRDVDECHEVGIF